MNGSNLNDTLHNLRTFRDTKEIFLNHHLNISTKENVQVYARSAKIFYKNRQIMTFSILLLCIQTEFLYRITRQIRLAYRVGLND